MRIKCYTKNDERGTLAQDDAGTWIFGATWSLKLALSFNYRNEKIDPNRGPVCRHGLPIHPGSDLRRLWSVFWVCHVNQFFFFFFQFCIPLHPQTLGFPSDGKLTTLLLLEAVLCLLFWLEESRREDFMWNDVLDEAWIRRIQHGEKNSVF